VPGADRDHVAGARPEVDKPIHAYGAIVLYNVIETLSPAR
jgi:hypothetical protein